MQNTWQDFLMTRGATCAASGYIRFADEAQTLAQLGQVGVISSLDHLGVIRVAGADAQAFLQGQFSNDIKQLEHAQFQISAYCNPKGRMLAQFYVLPDNDAFVLLLPRALLATTLRRLQMFVLRSQVTLVDASDTQVCLGLISPDAPAIAGLTLPETDYQLTSHAGVIAGKVPAPQPRYLLLTDQARAEQLWAELTSTCRESGASVWHWLDIQAGIPSVWPQTVEEFVPQMLNLELINGVNFKKGCYPGQEIVARMHYLGKPKRRMYRLQQSEGQAPEPGMDIYTADGDTQSAGKVVLSQTGPQGTELLAVVQVEKAAAALHLGAPDGPRLTRAELPYPLEKAE